MTNNRPRAHRVLAGVVSSLFLLAACGGSDDTASDTATLDPVDTTTTEPVTDEPESTDPAEATVATAAAPVDADPAPATTEPAPVTTVAAPATTEPAPAATDAPGGNLPDCLIGNWIVNEEEMNAYYMALGENSGAGLEITADGNMLITMTATDYVFTADYTVHIDVAGQTGTGVATGTANGTWTVEDEVIQSSLTDSDLNIDVTVGGLSFDGSDLGNSLLQSDPFANTPVSCDGPTLLFQSGPTEDIRHPVVLTPA